MPTAVQPDLRPKTSARSSGPLPHPSSVTTPRPVSQLQRFQQKRPAQSQWLRVLIKLRQFSTPVALLMVAGVLPLYGWSVTTQHSWGERYDQLQQLRRDQRQYETLTENLKHRITQEAEENPVGYVPQGPTNTVFLPQQPPRPLATNQVSKTVQLNPLVKVPLAY
ncbi:MAG: hypothetical protein WCD18_23915 [Thermosynechococcaceae cyanobacterium]